MQGFIDLNFEELFVSGFSRELCLFGTDDFILDVFLQFHKPVFYHIHDVSIECPQVELSVLCDVVLNLLLNFGLFQFVPTC